MLASPTQERKELLLLRERKQTTLHYKFLSQPLHTITVAIYRCNATLFDFIFFLICLSLCFIFLFGGLGLVVLGIGGNRADFRDIFRDHLLNQVDGWSLNGNTWCKTEAPKELLRFVIFDWDTCHFPFSFFIICSVEVAWKYCEVHWIWKVKCEFKFLSVGSWYKTSWVTQQRWFETNMYWQRWFENTGGFFVKLKYNISCIKKKKSPSASLLGCDSLLIHTLVSSCRWNG